MNAVDLSIENRLRLAASRALGMIDNNPLSKTAGCADRGFWHYQDSKGFAVGSFQVAMLGLAVAGEAFNSSAYALGADLALQWWAKEVHQCGGMIDEYFPNQHSFCATSYTSLTAAIVCLARHQAGLCPSEETLSALRLALSHLAADETRPISANQTFAARLAWDVAASELSPFKLVASPNPFIPLALSEGLGFSEYGGFDLGYSLKCVDLCVLGLSILSDELLRKIYREDLDRLLSSLYLLVVEGTFAPELGSRGNPHLLLGGLKVLAANGDLCAASIVAELEKKHRFPALVPAESCDDKYLCFFHLTSLALEYASNHSLSIFSRTVPASETQPPNLKNGLHCFESIGLLLYKSEHCRLAISELGGSYHLEHSSQAHTEKGYIVRNHGKLWGPASVRAQIRVEKLEDGYELTLPLLLQPYPERTLLLQKLTIGSLLKALLIAPGIGTFLRNLIYNRSKNSPKTMHVGDRKLKIRSSGLQIEDKMKAGLSSLVRARHWSLVDGHATRMHGHSECALETSKADSLKFKQNFKFL